MVGFLIVFFLIVGAFGFFAGSTEIFPVNTDDERTSTTTTVIENAADTSFDESESDLETITVGDAELMVEVADTQSERTQGLSGRASLAPMDGLLFVFDEPGTPGIWMKDMNFAIDLIWISEDGVVVEISENFTPESFPEIRRSSETIKYLIETEVGFAKEQGIEVGDKILLP